LSSTVRSRIFREKLNSLSAQPYCRGRKSIFDPIATGLGTNYFGTLWKGVMKRGNVLALGDFTRTAKHTDYYVKYGLSSASGVQSCLFVGYVQGISD